MASMAASVIVGTALGTRLLHRLDDAFTQLYRAALTLVALRLVWSGLSALDLVDATADPRLIRA